MKLEIMDSPFGVEYREKCREYPAGACDFDCRNYEEFVKLYLEPAQRGEIEILSAWFVNPVNGKAIFLIKNELIPLIV